MDTSTDSATFDSYSVHEKFEDGSRFETNQTLLQPQNQQGLFGSESDMSFQIEERGSLNAPHRHMLPPIIEDTPLDRNVMSHFINKIQIVPASSHGGHFNTNSGIIPSRNEAKTPFNVAYENIQASPTVERRQFNANYSGIQSGNIQASPTVERRQFNANYRRMQSPIQGKRLLDVSYRHVASSTPKKATFETNRAVFSYSKQLINNNKSLPVNKTVLPSSFGTNRGVASPHSTQVLTTNNQSMPVNKTVLPSSFDTSKHNQILRTNEVDSAVFQQLNSGGIQLATNNQTAQTQFGDKIVPMKLVADGRAQFFTKNETMHGRFGERRQTNTGDTSMSRSKVVGDRVPLRTHSGIKAEGKISLKDNTGTVPLQFQDGRSVRPEAVVNQSMMIAPTNLDTKMNNATMPMSSLGGGVTPKPNIPSRISSSKGGHSSAIDKMFSGRSFNKENMKPSSVSGSTINKMVSSSIRPTGGVFDKENVKSASDEERGNINQHTFQAVGERQSVRPTKDILSCPQGGEKQNLFNNNSMTPSMIGERKQTNTTDLSVPCLSSVSSTFVTPTTIGGRKDFNTANMIGERKICTTTDLNVLSLSSASTTPTTIGGRKELFNPSLAPQIDGAPTDISLATSFVDQDGPNQEADDQNFTENSMDTSTDSATFDSYSVHEKFEDGSRFETNQTLLQPQNQQGLFGSESDMSFQIEERGSLNAPHRHMLPPIIEDTPLDRNVMSHFINKIQIVPASSHGGHFNTNSGIIPSRNEAKTPFNVAYENIQASPTVERRQFNANYSGIQSGNIQASPTVERRQFNANYRRMQSPIQGKRLLDVSYRHVASSTPKKATFETNRAVFSYSKQLINNNKSLPVNKTVLPSSFGTNRGVASPHSTQVLTTNNQSMPVNKTVLPSSFDTSKHNQILRTNEVDSAVFQQLNSGGIQLATNNQTAQTQFGDKIVPMKLVADGRAQFFTKNETMHGRFGERRQTNTGDTSMSRSKVVGDRVPLRTHSGIKAEGKISLKDNTGTVPLQFQDGRSVRPEAVVNQSMMIAPTNLDTKMNNATMPMSSLGGGVTPKPNIPSRISSSKGGHSSAIDKMFSGRSFNKENMKPSSVSGSTINKMVSSSIRPTGGVFDKENVKSASDEERGNINQHTFQAVGERQSVRPTKDILSCPQGGEKQNLFNNNSMTPSMIGERKQTNTTDLSVPCLSSVSSTFVTPTTIGGRKDFNTANMIGERKICTTTDLNVLSLSSASTTPTTIGGRKELFNPSLAPQIDGAPTDISLATSFVDQDGPNQEADEMRHINMEADDGNNAMSQENPQSSQNPHFFEFTLRKLDASACLAEPVRLGPLLMREIFEQIPDSLLIAALSGHSEKEILKAFFNSEAFLPFIEALTSILKNDNKE
ncbi:uncharacterized protein LOC111046732 isoform X2 [Nilaparvata lugens]|uniref:uncharacterized protein LOC111046732 isoform X2 n=1 Tax=Nilaparvata lugens TaxID=108931 RepID=UPI00193C882E|nr:uncharacterized protein LOC111046732 isoform X2 [Nilaparvata lugens]